MNKDRRSSRTEGTLAGFGRHQDWEEKWGVRDMYGGEDGRSEGLDDGDAEKGRVKVYLIMHEISILDIMGHGSHGRSQGPRP